MRTPITARTVETLLNAALGNQMAVARYEGLCVGDSMQTVTGVAVCYAPTVSILRQAIASRQNLIIAREHPFYLHGGPFYAYTSESLLREDPVIGVGPGNSDRDMYVVDGLAGDPVVTAKRKMILDAGLVIYRYGAAWDEDRPAAQSAALARALGFTVSPEQEGRRRRCVVCDVEAGMTIATLMTIARTQLKSGAARVVGNGGAMVRRPAVLAGESDPREALAEMLSDPLIDCVITGAGGISDEVDGSIAYFRDVLATGRRIVMLTVGYGPSHEPGVREMADALRMMLPDLNVNYVPSGDPSWIA